METLKVANGLVQGVVKSVLENDVIEFLAIPYCKPPINELRFRKPQPCDTFKNEIINKPDFETYPPQSFLSELKYVIPEGSLWHPKGIQDEDCLYLNVWCPVDILRGQEKRPVLAYVHGGGFLYGSSSYDWINGAILASQEKIVVVSLNYRLALLGFICLDEEEMNGNLGMWDQVCALKWIHENISVFNGDSGNITISGNSAGGCSVSLHLIIEQSWPYFNKAIPASGVCLSNWGVHSKEEIMRGSMTAVNKILEKFHFTLRWDHNMPKKDKTEIIHFLQKLNFREFLHDFELVKGFIELCWTPFVDGDLIKNHPKILLENSQFKKCPTMFLHSENEGYMFRKMNFQNIKEEGNIQIDMDYLNQKMEYYPHYPSKCPDSIIDRIKKEYNVEEVLTLNVLDRIIGDDMFVYDIMEMANVISDSIKDVYYLWHRTIAPSYELPIIKEAMHASELYYYFGNPFKSYITAEEGEKEASKVFMAHFGKFINEGHLDRLPRYDRQSRSFIVIDGTDWHGERFSEDHCRKLAFWKSLRGICDSCRISEN